MNIFSIVYAATGIIEVKKLLSSVYPSRFVNVKSLWIDSRNLKSCIEIQQDLLATDCYDFHIYGGKIEACLWERHQRVKDSAALNYLRLEIMSKAAEPGSLTRLVGSRRGILSF